MDPLIQKYHKLLLKYNLEIEKQLTKDLKFLPIESVKVMQKLIQEVNNIIANNNLVDEKLEIKAAKDKLEFKLKKIIETGVNKSLLAENLIMEQIISAQMVNSFIANKFVDELGGLDTPSFLDFSKINNKIDLGFEGRNFKTRNSINKLDLKNTLNNEVHKFLNGETRARDIQKILRQKFAYNAYQAETLTRTEVATAQSLVHDEYARETGVQIQLFNATLDGKTSKICQRLDDSEWNIDDPNKPIPGIGTHPRCRSRLLNIPRPGWRPSTRRDNTEKFKTIPYQKYNEWKKENEEVNNEG